MASDNGFGWRGFGIGIGVALLWGAGMLLAPQWTGPSGAVITADPTCDPTAAPCSVALPEGSLSLAIDPPGAPPDQPLEFTVVVPPGVVASEVRLTGRSMPMGEVRVPLVLQDEQQGRYSGTMRLPVCVLAEMEWGAEVRLEPETSAIFTVWSKTGGVVVDGSVVPAVEPTYPMFTVHTAQGPQALSDWKGDAVVVYFGYTSCPDICPTTLGRVGAAFKLLPPELQGRAHGVLVTLDPERDTLERLASYTAFFGPEMIGGQIEDLQTIAPAWGMSWRRVTLPDSALGYAMDHGTDAYLIGPEGRFARKLPHGLSAESIKNALMAVLKQDSPAAPSSP